jgi:F-type H+-transporting ATPase subunit a
MIATTLVTLALGLSLAQHGGEAAPEKPSFHEGRYTHEQLEAAGAAQLPHHPAAGEEGAAGEHGAVAEGHEGHGEAGEHGGAHGGGHDTSLGGVMMHHVGDGYVIEHPGYCEKEGVKGFAWNCEWNLRETFGESLKFGSVDMTPTKHVIMMWIATALLLGVLFASLRKKGMVPKGLYNFIELLVSFVRKDIAVPNIGEKDAGRFVPYLLTAFFFILFVNLFGLLPFSATATANLSVTAVLALFTFFITQYAAIRAQGIGGYLAHLTGGVPVSLAWLWPIMIPVEFLGLFTKPFALTVRLFANMVAGHFVILALLGLIYAISFWVFPVSVALALAIFMLELFVAFVQAYIFTMLSALFIGAGLAHHGHDEGHGHGEEHAHGHAEAAHH